MIYSIKRFSQILGIQGGSGGFRRNNDGSTRKYDTDMNRLGRMGTAQSELRKIGNLTSEMRKLQKELRNG